MEEPPWDDPVVAFYRQGVDRSLLRANLKLTPAQRLEKYQDVLEFMTELRRAGKRARAAGSE